MFKFRISRADAIAHFKLACKGWFWMIPMVPVLHWGHYKWCCADAERQLSFRDKSALYGVPPEQRGELPPWPGLRD